MIKELERHIIRNENNVEISCPPDRAEIVSKINELIESVNKQNKAIHLLVDCIEQIAKQEKESVLEIIANL